MDRQPDATISISSSRAATSFRVLTRVLAAALMVASLSGCQIVIGVMQILQGFPKNTCDFTAMTKKKLAEKGKKVIVLSSSNAGAQSEEPSLDLDIIAEFSRRLMIEKVDVVDPHKVTTFVDDNGGITEDTPLEPIGLKFKADYIVLFKFDDFGYLEENSPSLYRGHASYKVVVVEMIADKEARGGKRAKIIYNKPFTSKYPANQPISAEQIGSPDIFKRQYLARLSQEIGHLFIDHRIEDEI